MFDNRRFIKEFRAMAGLMARAARGESVQLRTNEGKETHYPGSKGHTWSGGIWENPLNLH